MIDIGPGEDYIFLGQIGFVPLAFLREVTRCGSDVSGKTKQ